MLSVIFASCVIMLTSLIGVISLWGKMGNVIARNLSFLVSFSSGVFLIVAYELLEETFEHATGLAGGLVWITVGIGGLLILFKFLPQFHHHHSGHDEQEHAHTSLDARRILLSDGMHNIGDGILLSAAFAVDTRLGILTTSSVFIHEILQEISEFFVLKEAGYSTKKALFMNFIVSGTILIGALGSFFLLENFEGVETMLLGISAGAFVVVVFHDLIPHSVRQSRKTKSYLRHALWFLTGAALMSFLSVFATH